MLKNYRNIREDAIDDIGSSVRALRGKEKDYVSKLAVGKNLLKGPSKGTAQKYAKAYGKTWTGDDWTKTVRKAFTSKLSFNDTSLYRKLTIEMRQILVVDKSDDNSDFQIKDELRKETAEAGIDYRYYNIDKVATAELVTIFIFDMFYSEDDLKVLSDQDKYDTAIFCAKEVINRIENTEDVSDELLAGDIVKDYENEYGIEPIGNETEILSGFPFEPITIDIDKEIEKDLSFTKDEIAKDKEDRAVAYDKHETRTRQQRDDALDMKKALKDLRSSRYDKLIRIKLPKLGFKSDDYDLFLDRLSWEAAISYAHAGWDYSNVDHDAEEAIADAKEVKGIEKYGRERWNDVPYLQKLQAAILDMPIFNKWLEKYPNLFGTAKDAEDYMWRDPDIGHGLF